VFFYKKIAKPPKTTNQFLKIATNTDLCITAQKQCLQKCHFNTQKCLFKCEIDTFKCEIDTFKCENDTLFILSSVGNDNFKCLN
jgi:hypothetical protein